MPCTLPLNRLPASIPDTIGARVTEQTPKHGGRTLPVTPEVTLRYAEGALKANRVDPLTVQAHPDIIEVALIGLLCRHSGR